MSDVLKRNVAASVSKSGIKSIIRRGEVREWICVLGARAVANVIAREIVAEVGTAVVKVIPELHHAELWI